MSKFEASTSEFTASAERSRRARYLVYTASFASVLALATPAFAQSETPAAQEADSASGLDEIIVTAQKRAQSLQDVPVSVSALTSDSLVANRVASVRDLDGAVPNLTVRTQAGGSGVPYYTMRGLVAIGTAAGSDKGIALYIDGVYLGSSYGSAFELAAIERVEVLRGPQGTLFGRNSTGGAVSISTPEPTGEFSLKNTQTFGNYDQFKTVTRLNTPTIGAFSASLAYTHSERRGDIRNNGGGTVWDFTGAFGGKKKTYTSPDYLGNNNVEAFAAAVKFDPESNFKAIYRFDYTTSKFSGSGAGTIYESSLIKGIIAAQPNPSAIAPIALKRPDELNNWATVPTKVKNFGHSLVTELEVSDAISLKNTAAYRKTTFNVPWTQFDSLGGLINTGAPIFANVGLTGTTAGAPLLIQATSTTGSDKQISNEFQANYNSDLLTLTAGALYYRQKQTRAPAGEESGLGRARSGAFRVYPGFQVPYSGQPGGTQGRITNITMRSYAFFTQGEFHVTPQLDLVGGIRYTNDKKTGTDRSLANGGNPALIFPLSYADDEFTYSLGANYKFDNGIMVYAKYSTGYISGGALAGITYQPEKAKSWEGGVKAELFDRRVRANLAVFSVDYTNLQTGINGSLLTPPNPNIPQALVNAGNAKAKGFEFETTVVPVDGLTFSGGLGYTDFKYTTLSPLLLVGQKEYLPVARPDWTANVSGQYETPVSGDVNLLLRMDGSWRSKQYMVAQIPNTSASFSAADQVLYKSASTVAPYWIVNGRVGIEGFKIGGAKASAALWARNLFDNKSITNAISIVTTIMADYERARTFGVDLTLEL